jgi:hypothetical protein
LNVVRRPPTATSTAGGRRAGSGGPRRSLAGDPGSGARTVHGGRA